VLTVDGKDLRMAAGLDWRPDKEELRKIGETLKILSDHGTTEVSVYNDASQRDEPLPINSALMVRVLRDWISLKFPASPSEATAD
jgi:hypothetical protein